jgi:hypothetical protein
MREMLHDPFDPGDPADHELTTGRRIPGAEEVVRTRWPKWLLDVLYPIRRLFGRNPPPPPPTPCPTYNGEYSTTLGTFFVPAARNYFPYPYQNEVRRPDIRTVRQGAQVGVYRSDPRAPTQINRPFPNLEPDRGGTYGITAMSYELWTKPSPSNDPDEASRHPLPPSGTRTVEGWSRVATHGHTIHLHHLNIWSTGRPDPVCRIPDFEQFAGTGNERTWVRLDPPHYYLTENSDTWHANVMIENYNDQPFLVAIEFTIYADHCIHRDPAPRVRPYLIDILGCEGLALSSTFHIPHPPDLPPPYALAPNLGSAEHSFPDDLVQSPGRPNPDYGPALRPLVRCVAIERNWTPGRAGRIVWLGAHFHTGAIDMALRHSTSTHWYTVEPTMNWQWPHPVHIESIQPYDVRTRGYISFDADTTFRIRVRYSLDPGDYNHAVDENGTPNPALDELVFGRELKDGMAILLAGVVFD